MCMAAPPHYRRMAAGTDQMAGVGSLITNGTNALVQLYYAWAIETAIFSSFILQLVLIIFAGIRRRHASRVIRSIVWGPYQLAVFTTTFGLGHLSVSSWPPERQKLVAFWAPFLLLHVGGPDSITAYSIDDNRLWKRQVLKFVPKVLSTASVLYKTFSAADGSLFPAAWLMFAVGVAKYGERVWALYQGNLSTIRKAVESEQESRQSGGDDHGGGQQGQNPRVQINGDGSPEDLLLCAHSQFEVCKGAMVDSSSEFLDTSELGDTVFSDKWEWEKRWTVFQMEVSLLYDIMYTKAGVIHTWHGYFLRVFSPLATAGALLLFHLSPIGTSAGAMDSPAVRADVAITHALLVSAILLDIVSLVSAAASGWAYAFLVSMPRPRRHGWLYHAAVCNDRCRRLHSGLEYLRSLVNAQDRRKWSGAIGQHNLLQFCTSSARQQSKKKYTGPTVVIPPEVMELVFNELERVILRKVEMVDIKFGVSRSGHDDKPYTSGEIMESGTRSIKASSSGPTGKKTSPTDSVGLIKAEKGQHAVAELKLKNEQDQKFLKRYIRDEIQEGILIWHIATDVYLRTCEASKKQDTVVRAIKLLSNYLMFLMVEHPSMVPGIDLRKYYIHTYKKLSEKHAGGANGNPDRLAETLAQDESVNPVLRQHDKNKALLGDALWLATKLALKLVDLKKKFAEELKKELEKESASVTEKEKKVDMVTFLFYMWVELLLYVSHRCSRESHAKKLSEGGELTTIVWLMAEQAGKFHIDKKLSEEDDVD